jgi:hypothetical protein
VELLFLSLSLSLSLSVHTLVRNPKMSAPSSAARVLTSRATQCSFSSIYHLKNAGMERKQALHVESIFKYTVVIPLAVIGVALAGAHARTKALPALPW